MSGIRLKGSPHTFPGEGFTGGPSLDLPRWAGAFRVAAQLAFTTDHRDEGGSGSGDAVLRSHAALPVAQCCRRFQKWVKQISACIYG
jgi:hypothetical protein